MKTLQRYLRAFFLAVKMTLRGEKLPERVQHPLAAWVTRYAALVDAVYQVGETSGLNREARLSAKIRIDGRPMSVETILAALRFHARQEYPSLFKNPVTREVMNTVYATNLNDHFWVTSLQKSEALQQPTVQAALAQLEAHLQDIPRE